MKRRPLQFLAAALVVAACTGADPSPPTNPPSRGNAATTATNPQGQSAEIAFVLDGDSIEVILDDGSPVEVRLMGINAPEGDECHGDEARAALEALLRQGSATLVTDDEEADQFGRALRYVYVDGVNVNQSLIETGNALAIQNGHPLDDPFAASSDRAAAAGLGMWAKDACDDVAVDGSVVIVDYVFDPRGRDAENQNGEWIALVNRGADPIRMDGWTLRDESTQNRFVFPAPFVLGTEDEIRIHSGCGTDSSTDLYWCARDPVWSNGGDTIILQNANGTVVARERYAGAY